MAVTDEAVVGHDVKVGVVDGEEQANEARGAVNPLQVLYGRGARGWGHGVQGRGRHIPAAAQFPQSNSRQSFH